MLKKHALVIGLACACLVAITSCGYYFPHVYEGKHRVIYAATWKNRTNKLKLDMTIYKSLSRWFQKTQSVDLTKNQIGADYILSGEIISIDLPTVSWDTNSDATGTKVKLYVRYALKDRRTGAILWQENNKLYTADYTVAVANSAADDEALAAIIEDMSEIIYLATLKQLRKQDRQSP